METLWILKLELHWYIFGYDKTCDKADFYTLESSNEL